MAGKTLKLDRALRRDENGLLVGEEESLLAVANYYALLVGGDSE